MARYDDLNTTAIAYTTFISSIILLLIILLGRALCYTWIESEDERKLANARYVTSDAAISDQKAMLDGYRKVQIELPAPPPEEDADPQGEPEIVIEERVHIPIDKARELLLKELAQEPTT